MESSAAGANERAEVMLVATDTRLGHAKVLSMIYHTTNEMDNTSSASRGSKHHKYYPESRLLWTEYCRNPGLRQRTMLDFVRQFSDDRGWPRDMELNASVLNLNDDNSILSQLRAIYITTGVTAPVFEVESENEAPQDGSGDDAMVISDDEVLH